MSKPIGWPATVALCTLPSSQRQRSAQMKINECKYANDKPGKREIAATAAQGKTQWPSFD